MSARFLFVCATSVVVLLFAKSACAEGAYQRTEERKKTFVWNNDRQPNDAASWSGERDEDGYATGAGTLKWFKLGKNFTTGSNIAGRKKTEISSYTGTMVRGKFTGPVVTVDHGKTYHANFVDGRRKGVWVEGPVIAKAESAEKTAPAEKAETKAPSASVEVTAGPSATKEKPRETTEAQETTDIPAAGPTDEKPEVTSAKAESNESDAQGKAAPVEKASQPLIAQASTEESDQATTPREPVTRKGALAPGAVRAIDRPTQDTAKKSETQRPAPAARAKKTEEKIEKTSTAAKPAPSQPAEAETNIAEDIPADGPSEKITEAAPSATPAAAPKIATVGPTAKETPVDDSIRALTGPPSALRSSGAAETNPPADTSTATTAAAAGPSAAAAPKLTAVNAMDIADIEARTRGYDLGEFQLPKAEYNSSNDTWSVSYAPRSADLKQLNVTIQDKNGKAEIKK